MHDTRPAAVAGVFYPGDEIELEAQVRGFIRDAIPAHHAPVAIIAPHAGYIYSGPIAGSAFAPLQDVSHSIDHVLLLGPAHREWVPGIAASSAGAFDSPLGPVQLDTVGIRTLVEWFDFVDYDDRAHAMEHSLEVHLPFLQLTIGDFVLTPLAVGGATAAQVQAILEQSRKDESTLIVVSSDLSHYNDYDRAQTLDRLTSEKIKALEPDDLTTDSACGHVPVRGLIQYALKHDLACEVIDVRNSGDTAGTHERVVGYGAYLFFRSDRAVT